MKNKLYMLRGGLWCTFLFAFCYLQAQTPWIDVVPGSGSSLPIELAIVGNTLYFTATTPSTGIEAFKTTCDGGLDMDPSDNVMDILPGTGASGPYGYTEWNGQVYFIAFSAPSVSLEIYTADANCNFSVANANSFNTFNLGSVTAAGDYLLTNNGSRLEKMDMMGNVVTIVDNLGAEITNVSSLKYLNSTVLFGGNSGGSNVLYELDDLTTNVANPLLDNVAESIVNPRNFIESGGFTYFIGDSPSSGTNVLYCYDGTNPPFVVMNGGSTISPTADIAVDIAGVLYFSDNTSTIYSITSGVVSTLTPSTTASSCDGLSTNNTPSGIQNLLNLNGTLAIVTTTGVYVQNGTEIEVLQDGMTGLSNISASSGNTLYFQANSGADGVLWSTDGSSCPMIVDAGVTEITDITPIPGTNDVFIRGTTVMYGTEIYKSSPTRILTVEFLEFTALAQKNSVDLEWLTASEIDNKGFEVERSKDAKEWETLTFVKGNGTSNEINRYDFTDKIPLKGLNYYRLKQIDIDGTSSYSELETVVFADKNIAVQSWPNPVQNTLHYIVHADENDDLYEAKLYNLIGVELFNLETEAEAEQTIDLSGLPAGNYYLRVTTRTDQYIQQIIKAN